MTAFSELVQTARARTGELGADWPKAATKIYTADQSALTGQAAAAEGARAGPEWLARSPARRARTASATVGRRRRPRARRQRTVELLFLRAGGRLPAAVLRLPDRQERRDGLPALHERDVLHRRRAVGGAGQLQRRSSTPPCSPRRWSTPCCSPPGRSPGSSCIGLALALYFQRRFPLSGVLRSLLLLPWLIPLIVSSAIWRWILDQDNGR